MRPRRRRDDSERSRPKNFNREFRLKEFFWFLAFPGVSETVFNGSCRVSFPSTLASIFSTKEHLVAVPNDF